MRRFLRPPPARGGRAGAGKLPPGLRHRGLGNNAHVLSGSDLGPPVEVRIRAPDSFSSVVYFSRGTLPPKRVKGHYWGS